MAVRLGVSVGLGVLAIVLCAVLGQAAAVEVNPPLPRERS